MGWYSVRVKLTLWNVLVLAVVLGGFGIALCYSVQANQAAAIDRELASRAQRPPRGPRGPGGPPREGGQGRPDRDGPFIGREGRIGTAEREGQIGPAPRPDGHRFPPRLAELSGTEEKSTSGTDASASLEAMRRHYFGRPLMFDREGHPRGPFSQDRPWDPAAFQIAANGGKTYSTVMVGAERLRVFTMPLERDGKPDGVIQVAHPLGEQDRLATSQVQTLLLLLPLALLIAGLGGLFLTDRALQPVRKVTQTAAQIGAEDLSRRLEVKGKDELAELARTFNGMIGRLEGAFSGLAAAYRELESAYERQRRFTGDASHELRTPLTYIKASTSLALSTPCSPEEYREALVVADQAADAMSRIVQDLLLLARSDSGQLSPQCRSLSVDDLFHSAVNRLPERAGPPISLDLPPERLELVGDEEYLRRLLINLLENAIHHTPRDGRVLLSARPEENRIRITVADTGEGVAPEHLPHLCERFYRVDSVRTGGRGGTGLGLAICEGIVQAHGGTLSIQSRLGEGTTVEIVLPSTGTPVFPTQQAGARIEEKVLSYGNSEIERGFDRGQRGIGDPTLFGNRPPDEG